MCTVCGCKDIQDNKAEDKNSGKRADLPTGRHHRHDHHRHDHHRHDHHRHDHHHHDHHHHENVNHHHYGVGDAGLTVPGFSQGKLIEIEQSILSRNDHDAAHNRSRLASYGICSLNLVSSPGAGKTTLLVKTLLELKQKVSVNVIEGDQETENDADRIRGCNVPAVQINTGRGCHLDAHMVGHALDELPLEKGGVLFIENVGNLVCPAAFDLGESFKVAILSVTEGDDKPIKYPDMFAAADLMLLSKIDLLPYTEFSPEKAFECAHRVNPQLQIISLSATSGEGMNNWIGWILSQLGESGFKSFEETNTLIHAGSN